jgi:hypothetical protein
MAETSRERVAEHKKRQTEQGLKRVSVWVPEGDVDRLREIAKALRMEGGALLPGDGPQPPKIAYPKIPEENPELVYVEIARHEKLYQQVLKANGARWNGQRQRWLVRRDVALELGLQNRIAGPAILK